MSLPEKEFSIFAVFFFSKMTGSGYHPAAYVKGTEVLPQGVLLTDWTNSSAVVRATNCDDVSGSRIFYSGKFVSKSITNRGINFSQMTKYIMTFNLVGWGAGGAGGHADSC